MILAPIPIETDTLKHGDLVNRFMLAEIYARIPIWDESKRQSFANTINRHFFYREIACIDVNRWLYEFETELQIDMQWLNPLFAKWDDGFEFANWSQSITDSNSTQDGTSNGTQESTNASTANAQNKAFSSSNPRSSMAGKNPPDYYDAGQFGESETTANGSTQNLSENTSHSAGVNHAVTRTESGQNTAGQFEAYLSTSYPMKLLFKLLEPLYTHYDSMGGLPSAIADLVPNRMID